MVCVINSSIHICHSEGELNPGNDSDLLIASICGGGKTCHFNLDRLPMFDVTGLVALVAREKASSKHEQAFRDGWRRDCCSWQHCHFKLSKVGTDALI